MEQIIYQLVANFDFALMLVINVITYGIIKFIDDVNGDKVPTTWQKRIVFLITAIVLGIIYKYYTDVSIHIIINSCIIAPVAWSWLAKPIAIKFGIDYKKNK
jgi:hypothetical protein